jgi:hypothetical protein
MLGGFVDERVLEVAAVRELLLTVAAFSVIADEEAGAKRFAWLATGSAAAWALKTCQVVV